MIEPNAGSTVLWDTLKLSAQPLRDRSDILVTAKVKVQEAGQRGSDEYSVNFELNRHHGIVSHDTEVLVQDAGEGDSRDWPRGVLGLLAVNEPVSGLASTVGPLAAQYSQASLARGHV